MIVKFFVIFVLLMSYSLYNTPTSTVRAIEGSGALTLNCDLRPGGLRITMIGPIQEGVLETRYGSDIRIEYGSDAYTWEAYTSGRNWTQWTGDWDGSKLREYTIELPVDVGRFNLFLYDAKSGGELAWFDVAQWTYSGDCWASGGGIDYDDSAAMDPTKLGIYCEVNGDEMLVRVLGDIQKGLHDLPPADQLIYLEYGGTDGWKPYFDDSKAKAVWSPANMSYDLIVPSYVQDMNLFLYGRYSGMVRFLDLDQWDVRGDCWRDAGQDIRHDDGSRRAALAGSDLKISCEAHDGLVTYKISGPMRYGLVSSAPEGKVFLEYGATDGWNPYLEGKPKVEWSPEMDTIELTTGAWVNDLNFFLYGPDSGQVVWFELDRWTVDGDCVRESGKDIAHQA